MDFRTTRNATLTATCLAAAGFLAPAEARSIKCANGYQLVAGNYLATPYCQDELLAKVAREHGMRASADRIRYNPNYKREVCRIVGNDIRVSEHCLNERPSIRSGGGH